MASYQRRQVEWRFQKQQAAIDLRRADRDIAAAQLRVAIAERELADFEIQTEQATAVRDWMQSKYTSADLYDWMVGELATLYYESYKLALDVARQAEKCFQWEQASEETFIQATYWDSLRKGLLAGDKLQLDLERLERGFLDADEREMELTKHISLDEVDPVALLQLRKADVAECSFETGEVLFDLDFPGHYLRRIKSVAVSVPCVSGGYLNVNAELSFTSGRTRMEPDDGAELVSDGDRGGDSIPARICTSSGQQDGGVFEMSLNDPRYLPFERHGVIGTWTLKLTSPYPKWDRESIADVVLHLRYTARVGDSSFLSAVTGGIDTEFAALPSASTGDDGPRRAFQLSRDFPDAWAAFFEPAASAPEHVAQLHVSEAMLPADVRAAGGVVIDAEIYLVPGGGVSVSYPTSSWFGVGINGGTVAKEDLVESSATGLPLITRTGLSSSPDFDLVLQVDQSDLGSTGFETMDALDPAKLVEIVVVLRFAIPSS